METPYTVPGERLREMAGYLRLLTALVQPAPQRDSLDPGILARLLKDLALQLDKMAQETELCRGNLAKTCEETRS